MPQLSNITEDGILAFLLDEHADRRHYERDLRFPRRVAIKPGICKDQQGLMVGDQGQLKWFGPGTIVTGCLLDLFCGRFTGQPYPRDYSCSVLFGFEMPVLSAELIQRIQRTTELVVQLGVLIHVEVQHPL